MHLTWQPGDPVIQLNFNNPLNTSVQLGDVAYFANTVPIGSPPHQHDQPEPEVWAQQNLLTVPPHETAGQSNIIMIGKIIEIKQFDGSSSHIKCEMPQDLFNQYFNDIQGVCIIDPSTIVDINSNPHVLEYIQSTIITMYSSTYPKPAHNILPDRSNTNLNTNLVHDPTTNNPPGTDYTYVRNYVMNQAFSSGNYDKWFGEFDSFLNTGGHGPSYYPQNQNSPYLMNPQVIGYPDPLNIHFCDSGIPLHASAQAQSAVAAPNYVWLGIDRVYVSPGLPGPNFYTANQVLDYFIGEGWNLTSSSTWQDVLDEKLLHDNVNFPGYGWTWAYCSYAVETCDAVGSFIMFSKDNKANQSDMLGYFALVEYRNNSTREAELYNVGAGFYESSK